MWRKYLCHAYPRLDGPISEIVTTVNGSCLTILGTSPMKFVIDSHEFPFEARVIENLYCVRLLLFIFQFGYIEENHKEGSASGNEDHANFVMQKAQFWFNQFDHKNRFRPKVLAKVSHGSK